LLARDLVGEPDRDHDRDLRHVAVDGALQCRVIGGARHLDEVAR